MPRTVQTARASREPSLAYKLEGVRRKEEMVNSQPSQSSSGSESAEEEEVQRRILYEELFGEAPGEEEVHWESPLPGEEEVHCALGGYWEMSPCAQESQEDVEMLDGSFMQEGQGGAEDQESASNHKIPVKKTMKRSLRGASHPADEKKSFKERAAKPMRTASEYQCSVSGVTWHAPNKKKRAGHGKHGRRGYWEARVIRDAQRY
jgi:hypothetical protein